MRICCLRVIYVMNVWHLCGTCVVYMLYLSCICVMICVWYFVTYMCGIYWCVSGMCGVYQ